VAKITDRDEQLVALKFYEYNLEAFRFTAGVHGEYGRWLIATTTAVHLGGIFFLGTLEGVPSDSRILPALAFVSGVVLILLSGLCAWWNWGLHSAIYSEWSNARMIVDTDFWPKADPKMDRWVFWSHWLSLGLGVASAACIPIGAALVTYAVS
jgi:hypothetical protein